MRAIIAAKTKKEAAAAFSMSLYIFNEYACETGNEEELQVALSDPGKVFYRPIYGKGEWEKQ